MHPVVINVDNLDRGIQLFLIPLHFDTWQDPIIIGSILSWLHNKEMHTNVRFSEAQHCILFSRRQTKQLLPSAVNKKLVSSVK